MDQDMGTEVDTQRKYYEQMAAIMDRTRGCRFNASQREQNLSSISMYTINGISIYLLALSIIIIIFADRLTQEAGRIIGGLVAVSSVLVLSLSLVDYAASRGTKSDRFQRNALRITRIMREVERELAKPEPDFDKLERLCYSYEQENTEHGLNHTADDNTMSRLNKLRSDSIIVSIIYSLQRKLFKFYVFTKSVIIQLSIACAIIVFTAYYIYGLI